MPSPYSLGLDKTPANYVPLSPLTFLERAAAVFPNRTSLVHGDLRYTWAETYARCRRLASALVQRGVGKGDTVSIMGFNTPQMYEAHFGVPMTGAVLHSINTRLDAATIRFMLQHSEAKVLLTDTEASKTIAEALVGLENPPLVIDIDDPLSDGGARLGTLDYEQLLAAGDANFAWSLPEDEWEAISLNYTSGTTGNPKGVVYHHRGAYLNAINNIVAWSMPKHSVYLWTLPMFHCNGWCFPWTVAARAGVNVCLRRFDPRVCFRLIKEFGVTHYSAAPIVHSSLANAPAELKQGIDHVVKGSIAGAAPPEAVLSAMEAIGFEITHVYGLTEVYGPATVCVQRDDWADMDISARAALNARQGVRSNLQDGLSVRDPISMEAVPHDGVTIGELMFRGNIVMKGYLKNPQASDEAFAGGWFHTGDLGVVHPDGYVQIKDRSKDIIISGGENISSIEVEDVIYKHPDVMNCAVVAVPHDKWGEVPFAFVELREGAVLSDTELRDYCREHLARFKVPKHFAFTDIPKTSTGKVQKFALRNQAKALLAID